MRCLYCHNPDTWSSEGGQKMDSDSILKQYDQNKVFYSNGGITLTGGEPLNQDVEPLVKMLIHHDFRIQIETNGTKPLRKNRHPWVS